MTADTQRPRDETIRVVVIEDSPIQREALVNLFEEDAHIRVVAAVGTGVEGVERVKALKPDLLTCDIGLPDIDGFDVVKRVMAEAPTPTIMLTATLRPKWRKDAYHALSLGAMEVIEKPDLNDLNDPAWRTRLQRQLKFIARSPVIPHVLERIKARTERVRSGHDPAPSITRPTAAPLPRTLAPARPANVPRAAPHPIELLTIVASAGGPKAVRALLEGLQYAFPLPVPVLVALHLGRHMGGSLATFLGQVLSTSVMELHDGATFEAGKIYIAPGRMHTEVLTRGRVRVFEELPDAAYSPSLDYFLWSVARVYGKSAIGVILTGMGSDGADGLLALRRAGGLTLGQDEATSLVYGMPRVAHEVGGVMMQQAPQDMSATICEWLGVKLRST